MEVYDAGPGVGLDQRSRASLGTRGEYANTSVSPPVQQDSFVDLLALDGRMCVAMSDAHERCFDTRSPRVRLWVRSLMLMTPFRPARGSSRVYPSARARGAVRHVPESVQLVAGWGWRWRWTVAGGLGRCRDQARQKSKKPIVGRQKAWLDVVHAAKGSRRLTRDAQPAGPCLLPMTMTRRRNSWCTAS